MKTKLWYKYAIVYLIIVAAFFFVNNVVGAKHIEKAMLNENKQTLYRELRTISEEYTKQYTNQTLTKEEFIRELRSVDAMLDSSLWVVRADGELLINAEDSGNEQPMNLVEAYPGILDKAFLSDVEIPGLTTEPMLCVVNPILDGATAKGYLILSIPMSRITGNTRLIVRSVNIIVGVVLGLIGLCFLAYAIYHHINLRRLTKAATAYADGDFSHELKVMGHDEYRDLGNSITYLSEQHSNLVEYQKNFIANISHDFRSPLTSIKGYAEAMKDGTIPYEIQGKYLNIILFETDRLSNLTNDLLDLSNFENKGVHLEWAPFDVVKMVKQSIMTFEGKCSQKNIHIRLVFATGEMYAMADRGKIQQVLHNLIDNAIKFSNQDGTIIVSVTERSDKIMVSVKDSGIGIPKESLNKVWERFYKTDLSRGKDKKGTGLGLSITKQIMNAHNENITVSSVEGEGTEFVFSLAKAEKTE